MSGKPVSVLFVGGGDGSLYALEADSGSAPWSRNFGSPKTGVFIWSSPAVYGGSVYIGVGSVGDCPLVAGKLVKLNTRTGATEATFSTVPHGCIGATIWTSPAIDEASGTVFVVTGNPGDCTKPEPLAEAMIALSAGNLSLIGAWSTPPATRVPDGDFGGTPTLFTATIDGVRRRLVGAASKNGFYYAFDRTNLASGPVWERPDLISPGHDRTERVGRQTPVCRRAPHRHRRPGVRGKHSRRQPVDGTLHLGGLPARRRPERCAHRDPRCRLRRRRLDPVRGELPQRPRALQLPRNELPLVYSPASVARGSVYIGNSDGTFYSFSPNGQ